MAKLVYNEVTGTYSIKSDSWTNGGVKINTDTQKIVHIPNEYVVFQGSLSDCKDFKKSVGR